jgi:hypothetical protein
VIIHRLHSKKILCVSMSIWNVMEFEDTLIYGSSSITFNSFRFRSSSIKQNSNFNSFV